LFAIQTTYLAGSGTIKNVACLLSLLESTVANVHLCTHGLFYMDRFKGEAIMRVSPRLDRYKDLVDASVIKQIYDLARSLAGLRVLHMNTTAQGGGVAEILQELIPLMQELGIKHDWKVIPLDEASGSFTARLVDMMQGYDTGAFPKAEKQVFLEKLRHSLGEKQDYQADLFFVHDFQLVPLAQFFPWMRPAIWFSHVDTAHPEPSAQQYIEQFLDPYTLACFNSQASVFKDLPPEKVQVVTLGIDPFRTKNCLLPKARGMELLTRCGIDIARPVITQVSRFGVWKNPWQVLDIYHQVKQQIPSVQLAMVGALEAKDDIKAVEILADLQRNYVRGDPDIHLLSDPAIIDHEVVNAFQRYSSVILQRSIREGFGFTVTEAMWKKQPVIGTNVTGIRMQITHGVNGYLVDDAETAAAYTIKLLQDRELWRELGENAYETVRQRFLFPTMVLDYLKALARALENAHAVMEGVRGTTAIGNELVA
jgi:trehalose synthase